MGRVSTAFLVTLIRVLYSPYALYMCVCKWWYSDPLVKLLDSSLPLPVPFVDRLETMRKPYHRFLGSDEAKEQVHMSALHYFTVFLPGAHSDTDTDTDTDKAKTQQKHLYR